MIQGHFGAALFISSFCRNPPKLHYLFIAAQIQDLLISIFAYVVLIEKVQLAITNENKVYPIELVYVPYSHGLFSTIVLAVGVYICQSQERNKFALPAAVLSHWLLDLLVHLPDLDICFPFAECPKAGLGLWRYLIPSIVVECLVVLTGFTLYVKGVADKKIRSKVIWRLLPLVVFMILVTIAVPFTPLPDLDHNIAIQTFVLYGIFAAVAWASERPIRLSQENEKEKSS